MKLNYHMHWPLLAVCRKRGISFAVTWERASEIYMGSNKTQCVEAMAVAVEELL